MSRERELRADLRRLVADLLASEGCSCCRDTDGHTKAIERLATVLRVPKYADGSGYDFSRYRSSRRASPRSAEP